MYFSLHSIWRRHRRLVTGIACGLLCYVLLGRFDGLHAVSRYVLAFDTGMTVYLLLMVRLISQADTHAAMRRVQQEYEGGRTILVLAVAAAGISLLAIAKELGLGIHLQGQERWLHVWLTIVTIILSWLFTHMMFAMHYAHMYYRDMALGKPPCLIFPGHEEPDYADFVYFAYIIGTSGQTADVSFGGAKVRRVGTIHCVLAFFYNAAVLALMINIASGLIGS